VARPRAAPPGHVHRPDSGALPARLVHAGPGSRLEVDPGLLRLRRARKFDPRTLEPVLRLGSLALLDLRPWNHALRHRLDHPPAPHRRDPEARGAPEGG